MIALDAIIFDLDGVLIDSESVWAKIREDITIESGGRWHEGATEEMMGMSSLEWSRYMRDSLEVPMEPGAISRAVVARLEQRYRDQVPLLPGAEEAVRAAAERWPVGLASSANRPLIDLVLELTGLGPLFQVTVSSEEVPRGKPAPDVYLETAGRLEVEAKRCAAVEDSANGIRSASAAGMRVVAIPRPDFRPSDDVLEHAETVLDSLAELVPALARVA
ncbi:MAG TPA: HAD family phosphatase [Solirubrobacterales bacterium]